jgi:hypothetical protein
MRARAQAIRSHDYAMAGRPVPAHAIPPAPQVISTSPLRYRGSAGAARYVVSGGRLYAVNLDGRRSPPARKTGS